MVVGRERGRLGDGHDSRTWWGTDSEDGDRERVLVLVLVLVWDGN